MHAIYQALNLEAQKSQLCSIIVARPEEKPEAKKAEASVEKPTVAESATVEEKDPVVQVTVTAQEEEAPEEGTKPKKTRKKAVKASE